MRLAARGAARLWTPRAIGAATRTLNRLTGQADLYICHFDKALFKITLIFKKKYIELLTASTSSCDGKIPLGFKILFK
jgi:hypothetical protein